MVCHGSFDWPGHEEAHVDYMRQQVARDARAGEFPLETPGKRSRGIGSVTGKEASAKMGQPAQFAHCDQLPCVLDHWSPTIVEADPIQNPHSPRRALDLCGFVQISTNRLLARDMFSGRGGSQRD